MKNVFDIQTTFKTILTLCVLLNQQQLFASTATAEAQEKAVECALSASYQAPSQDPDLSFETKRFLLLDSKQIGFVYSDVLVSVNGSARDAKNAEFVYSLEIRKKSEMTLSVRRNYSTEGMTFIGSTDLISGPIGSSLRMLVNTSSFEVSNGVLADSLILKCESVLRSRPADPVHD